MLLVLILAVWLGRQVNKAREQREAVVAVNKAGGWVHYDHEFVNGKLTKGREPWASARLRRWLGDEYFQDIHQVSLVYNDSTGKRFDNADVRACDAVLARLKGMTSLRVLLLKETQATDEGLRHIGKLTGLEKLFIWDARGVTDAGVAHLADLKNLKNVHINNSNLTDEGLAALSQLPRVETLSLQGNRFSDAGLARLAGAERLKGLYLGLGRVGITDAGLAHLTTFRRLEVLDLQGSSVTVRGLEQLKVLPNLKELWLSNSVGTDAEKRALQQVMPNLKRIR
jgi:hypothetical protein